MTTRLLTPPPPVPDVPYVIGIESGSPLHAVTHQAAQQAVWDGDTDRHRVPTRAVCDTPVVLARRWGAFARGGQHVDRRQVCAHCAWAVALDPATTTPADDALLPLSPVEAELALLTPTGPELDALALLLPDPLLVPRACRAVLAARAPEEPDGPRAIRLLARLAEHRPVLLMAEECAEQECDHATRAECYGDQPTAVCRVCSFLTGPEEGEWEGQVAIAVPAPCSVLTALTRRYR